MKETPHNTSSYQRLSDEDLVYRYVQLGEQEPFNILYKRYAHLVMGVCVKYLKDVPSAQDATQQIFIKIMDDLPRFQIQSFKPWLYQVAKNYCFMQLRKNDKTVYDDSLVFEDVESDTYWHHKLEQEQNYEQLELAMGQLNDEQRRCLQLFYYDKKNYADIAALQNMTLMKVKSAIQNGKRNLKIMLGKTNGHSV